MSAKKIVMMVVAVFIVAVALLLLFNSRLEEPPIKTKTLVENSTGNKESTEINYQEQTLIPIKHKYITEYQLPSKSGPNSMLVDDHGIVWTVGSYSHKLYMLDPNTNKMQSYQIPGEDDTRDRMSWSMLKDNEGFIWFGQFGSDKLWRFDPDHEKFVDFHTMTSSPFQMKLDSKTDEIWFTTLSNDKLGVVQKIENDVNSDNGYRINEFSIGNGSYPSGLTVQGDSIWVTELEKGKIAKFTSIRNYDGEITGIKKTVEIPITNEPFFSFPTDILFTDNNTSWITEHGPSTITQYTMSTHDVTRIPTAQNKYHVSSLPFWMRESHDGNGIWFNEHEGGSIAFLDTHNMTLTEFELPTNSPVIMLNLALDPQNSHKAWFSEWDLDKIGVVDIGVPEPFEIQSNVDKIVFDANHGKKDVVVDFEITKKNSEQNDTQIFLNTTSSMEPDGELQNMTSSFSENVIGIPHLVMPLQVKLSLHDQSINPGNYTIGISAQDGMIAKTIFQKLIVR